MRSGQIDRAVRDVGDACETATSVVSLCRAVHGAVDRYVPSDRWCGFAVDPSTVYATNGYHDEGFEPALIPRMLEIEYGAGDVNGFSQLARSETGVATLAAATAGDPARSARWRDVIEPSGLAHELRAVVRDTGGAWGGFVLLRGPDVQDFDDAEARLVADIGPVVSAAFRRVLVRQHLEHAEDVREAGILLLTGADLAIQTMTPAARRWVDELDDHGFGGRLPTAVVTVAQAAASGAGGPAAIRTRTRRGRWLTITAEPLERLAGDRSPQDIGLVLQPSRPAEIALIVGSAYGLSGREAEVVRLVAAGHTNHEIARLLGITRYTVADHLKSVFRKLDVATRGELTSRLFFDHYLPRSIAQQPAGVDGWFLPREAG